MENITIRYATFINFISKYSTTFIQIILNSILARLLTPDDYGIVAVVTVFTGFFYPYSRYGSWASNYTR